MKNFIILFIFLTLLGCKDDNDVLNNGPLRFSCDSNSFTVTPKILDSDSIRIAIPTSFSPTGNHLNDVFGLIMSKDADYLMSIYQNDLLIVDSLDSGWDGKKVNGELCDNGIYDYTVKLQNDTTKEFTIQGQVSLNAFVEKQVCGCSYEDMFSSNIWEFSDLYSEGCE